MFKVLDENGEEKTDVAITQDGKLVLLIKVKELNKEDFEIVWQNKYLEFK